jgi:O-antigen/teichoic acid export membrane protein
MHIDRKDVLWNYAATFLQIGAQVLLLPLILRALPRETVGIWTIFTTIIALVNLLDFGFNPTFTRNVTYVFSGAKVLKATGFEAVEENAEIDYGLLKGLIAAMRFFYSRMAVILLIALTTAGTWYINTVLKTYTGNKPEIYAAWIILCAINAYSFYTLYYDALLQGRGFIKRSKQIAVAGQSVYLVTAAILIALKFGLVAIVSAQCLSVVIRRLLSYLVFYTAEIKKQLRNAEKHIQKDILKAVYPNAVKLGMTWIGCTFTSRSPVVMGSLYLPLEVIASYGVTIQIINVISSIAYVYFGTYLPKIVQYRIQNDVCTIKNIYRKGRLVLLAVYILSGSALLLFGNWGLNLIGSRTPLLPRACIACALAFSLLELNQTLAGNILVVENKVPFFKAAFISGLLVVILMFVMFTLTNFGIWNVLLAPMIIEGAYQNWKWPLEAHKVLNPDKRMKIGT